MEYDYEHDDDFASRILWGRVGVYGASLLFMFVLGYCVAPSGVSQDDYDDAQQRIIDLAAENENLQNQLAALSAGQQPPPEDQPADQEPPAGPTYQVQSGDTLNSIASSRCGSTEFASSIAELNGIDAANRLQVGQVLQLSPECT